MKIKGFKKFVESISGTELFGKIGPNYGDELLPVTLSKSDTEVVFSNITNKFYTFDDWDNLYNQYLSKGGSPLDGFTKRNLDEIITFLN